LRHACKQRRKQSSEARRLKESRRGESKKVGPSHSSVHSNDHLEREAKAVAALSHPNILAIHDVGSDALTPGSVIYAVTELLEGETVRRRLASDPPPARKAVENRPGIVTGFHEACFCQVLSV
jgi:serine/threonine protein kinase